MTTAMILLETVVWTAPVWGVAAAFLVAGFASERGARG